MNYNQFLQTRPTTSIPRSDTGQYSKVKRLVFDLLTVLTNENKNWNSTYFRECLTPNEMEFLKKVVNGGNLDYFKWEIENSVQQLFKVKVYEGLESKGDTLVLREEYDINFPRKTNMLGKFKYDDMKNYLYKWHGKDNYTTKVYRAATSGYELEFSFE